MLIYDGFVCYQSFFFFFFKSSNRLCNTVLTLKFHTANVLLAQHKLESVNELETAKTN